MRNHVIAGVLLSLAMGAPAETHSEVQYQLQLSAVSRNGGSWSRESITPQDNRYDDDWITITWERTRFHFAVENRSGAPIDVDWDGARLAVEGAAEQRLIHGGIFLSDGRKPQAATRLQAW